MFLKKIIFIFLLLPGIVFSQEKTSGEDIQYYKLLKALNIFEDKYVDSLKSSELVETAIKAMLKEMDPHSVYIPADEVEAMDEPLQGNFEGIGIEFEIINDTLYIVNTIPGGPAETSGLLPGDRIIVVNGVKLSRKGLNSSTVFENLKGPKGSAVNLEILRWGDPEFLHFRLKRDVIPIYSIDASFMVNKQIGYIKVNRFSITTYDEFIEAVSSLQKEGMKKLILDLKGNGGGFLLAAIDIATEFLKEDNLILYTEGAHSPRESYLSQRAKGSLRRKITPGGKVELGFYGSRKMEKGDLAVLVDEGSASASEILAGAIQDWDRGIIIGRRTFGKGLVQSQLDLPDKSRIRLTTARYYTPSGRLIQKPYGNINEYQKEISDRFKHGEMNTSDSIHFNDSLRFHTLKLKRTVYGGGGIMPDVFVPLDTTFSSKYRNMLLSRGIISNVCMKYVNYNRDQLLTFSPEKFDNEFAISDSLIGQLINEASVAGINFNPEEFSRSKKNICLMLKLYIARNLFDRNDFYKFAAKEDESFVKAVELLDSKSVIEVLQCSCSGD